MGGTLVLNGTVDASGQAGKYGASGGSIYVTCGTVGPSSGALIAGGGDVGNTEGSGLQGGSAGRIATVCARHAFRSGVLSDVTPRFAAVGGKGDSPYTRGAPGTIWLDLGVHAATGARSPLTLLKRGAGKGMPAQPALLLWPAARRCSWRATHSSPWPVGRTAASLPPLAPSRT